MSERRFREALALDAGPAEQAAVADFQPERFTELESAEPLPDPTEDFSPRFDAPPADIFQEFQIDRRSLSELMAPSLDGLFKPFDPDVTQSDENFYGLADLTAPRPFDYEDLDTRDPAVTRTMAQAEARSREIISLAEAQGRDITTAARAEAQGLVAEAAGRAGAEAEVYAERLRREAEAEKAEAGRRLAEAESLAAGAESDRAEAAARLAAAQERIDGLDRERRELAAETEKRRLELEEDYQKLTAELNGRREEILAAAREEGRAAGHELGLAEGRAAGREEGLAPWREKTARLAELTLRLENIHQDLWRANGPLMVKLAVEAAEGILNKELREAGDLTVRAFEACVEFLGQAHRAVFQVRPQDIPLLEEAKAEQRQRLGALVKVSFQPDESLGPGDLIVESDVGRLDATIKHRAAQVLEVLRSAFAQQASLAQVSSGEAETGDAPPEEGPPEAMPPEEGPSEAMPPEAAPDQISPGAAETEGEP